MDLEGLLQGASQVARDAGALLLGYLGNLSGVERKQSALDLVTAADTASERLIVERLHALAPEVGMLAEESGAAGTTCPRWIVDPLDGTTNFAHEYPAFCVSIALEDADGVALGVVYDPTRDDLFAARRGGGATRNAVPLRVRAVDRLEDALLVTGFPYDVHTADRDNLLQFAAFLKRARAVRRDGSAALDLAYLAAGRFDGFWEEGLAPWDVAAGMLLVHEAGGRVTGYTGEPLDLAGRNLVAAGPGIHDAMVEVLREIEARNVLPPVSIRVC